MIDILVNTPKRLEMVYHHLFPTPGYSDLNYIVPEYIVPPPDGIQEIQIIGGEFLRPGSIVPQVLVPFDLKIELTPSDWCVGYRLSGKAIGNNPITIMRTLSHAKSIGDDEFLIHSANVLGRDKLIINGSFVGGCSPHKFQLSTTENLISLELSHQSNNDPCKSIVQFTLLFDLTPFSDKGLFSGFTGYFHIHYAGGKIINVPCPQSVRL